MDTLSVLERPFDASIVVFSFSMFIYLSLHVLHGRRNPYPLPPGPPSDFLIGSARYFPTSRLWESFCQWQKQYGDIVYARLPGTSFIMINSYELCQEVLTKRTSMTSGRDAGYMCTNIMGFGWLLSTLQPGVHHTNQKKILRKSVGPSAVGTHDSHIEQITNDFMLDLTTFQGYVPDQIMHVMTRLIVEITYGREIWKRAEKELATSNHEAMHLSELGLFHFWPVNFMPLLRFVPSWVPGLTFKRIGDQSTRLSEFVRYKPFEMALELHGQGRLGHCLASRLLDEFGAIEDVRDALAILYMTGADMTSGAINAFLFNMYLFPDVAERVFEEIRHVTQGQQALEIADRSSLPYTEAAWKESIRWNPFFTLGVPHVNSQEEFVRGVRIPKGSVIGQNIGFMLMDPRVWGDPERFRPERFLLPNCKDAEIGNDAGPPNPLRIVLGFGTRVCPGMYLADRAGFHLATTIVSLFRILPLEGHGRPDPATVKYTDMPLRAPSDFTARFVPRDQHAEYLLKTLSLDREIDR